MKPVPGAADEIAIFGSSGHAKVIIDIVEKSGAYIRGLFDSWRLVGETCAGYTVLGGEEELAQALARGNAGKLILAVGDNWGRYTLHERLVERLGPDIFHGALIHASAQIGKGVRIGEGSVVMAGAIINSDTVIGRQCVINTGACVDHDCKIGDFATIAPRVCLGGSVEVGAFSAVSLGAQVIHGRHIGVQTVIGAGSVVIRDIPDYVVAYGSPCRVVRERRPGDPYL